MASKGLKAITPTAWKEAKRFSSEAKAVAFLAAARWPKGVRCPHCGSEDVDWIEGRRVWECRGKHARRQFSVKIGTIFEDSRLRVGTCLMGVWLAVNGKEPVSSRQAARRLGVTQKSAWQLLRNIRRGREANWGLQRAHKRFRIAREQWNEKTQKTKKARRGRGDGDRENKAAGARFVSAVQWLASLPKSAAGGRRKRRRGGKRGKK